MKRRYFYLLPLCALALAACGEQPAAQQPAVATPTLVVRTPTPASTGASYRVQRGEVADAITLQGRVAATVDQDVFFQQNGFLKEVYVARGDQVKQGQLLAELEADELIEKLGQAKDDLSSAESARAQSQHQRQISIANAQLTLEKAQASREKLNQSVSTAELNDAQADIDRAKINLTVTKRTASTAKSQAQATMEQAANTLRNLQDEYSKLLWANGNMPLSKLKTEQRDAIERAKRAVDDAEAQLKLAQQSYEDARKAEVDDIALAEQDLKAAERKLETLKAGPSSFELAEADRDVRGAQLALESAQAADDSSSLDERISQSQRQLESIQKQLEATKLTAPFDGVVAEIGARSGDQIEAYSPIVNVMNPSKLEVVVSDVPSDDLARLTVGQAASLSFVQGSGASVAGEISKLPGNQAAGSAVKADLALRISFDPADLDLTVGDPAGITITLRRSASALWLPPQAINSFDQRHFVMLKDGAQTREVDVTLGIVAADRVEIVSGLSEGDTVVAPAASR